MSVNNADDQLSADQSLNNIEEATLEVHCVSSDTQTNTMGTGLLLTKNGVFITAYHVIESYLKERQQPFQLSLLKKGLFIKFQGNIHAVSQVICWNEHLDLAVCITNEPIGPFQAIKYKTCPARFIYNGKTVQIISVKNGKQYRQLGTITSEQAKSIMNDGTEIIATYTTDAYSLPGFSGGPVATVEKGELIGLVLYATKQKGSSLGSPGFAPIDNIEAVINYAKQYYGDILNLR